MATAKSIPGDVLGCLNALFEERELKRDLMVDIPSFDFPFYPTLSNKFVPTLFNSIRNCSSKEKNKNVLYYREMLIIESNLFVHTR